MKLYVVGFGSGSRSGITAAAEQAILNSDLIVGYRTYTEIISGFFPQKQYISNGMRQETARVQAALTAAQQQTVALICSGDPELYGMAGLALEMQPDFPDTEIEVIPGVTAAFSGGALLGAPLTHDFAVISLSDLLTPAEKIEQRLRGAALADFVIVLYNPASRHRPDYLRRACKILLEYRAPETVCGYVRNIGREGQMHAVLPLSALCEIPADMFTTVFIGSSETKEINGKMVTPRGYHLA